MASPERSPLASDGLAGSPGLAMSPEGSPKADAVLTEVMALKGMLDDPSSSQDVLVEALQSLGAHKNLSTKILGDTLIGKSVNNLAKSSPKEAVRNEAAKLVASWRDTHRKRKASFSLDRNQSLSQGSLDSQAEPGLSTMPSTMSTDSLDVPPAAAEGPPADKNEMTPKREKIREKIVEALGKQDDIQVKDGSADDGMQMRDTTELAAEIETALNNDLNDKEYLSQARAVLFNLKDKKNHMFGFKLSVGAIKPADVPKLTANDMASDAKNAERQKFKSDAMAAIDQDWAMKNGQIRISGLFTCGKCKGTQTTYFQMQTRSSDEPMTTFASCLQCGNRWKFC